MTWFGLGIAVHRLTGAQFVVNEAAAALWCCWLFGALADDAGAESAAVATWATQKADMLKGRPEPSLNAALGRYGLEVVTPVKPSPPETNPANPRANFKVVK